MLFPPFCVYFFTKKNISAQRAQGKCIFFLRKKTYFNCSEVRAAMQKTESGAFPAIISGEKCVSLQLEKSSFFLVLPRNNLFVSSPHFYLYSFFFDPVKMWENGSWSGSIMSGSHNRQFPFYSLFFLYHAKHLRRRKSILFERESAPKCLTIGL